MICPCSLHSLRPQSLLGDTTGSYKLFTLLDLCVSSLRRGHANLLCIVPILTDDPRRESRGTQLDHTPVAAVRVSTHERRVKTGVPVCELPKSNTWLRTNGANTNGAAAKVIMFDSLGEKVRPGTFGNIKVG